MKTSTNLGVISSISLISLLVVLEFEIISTLIFGVTFGFVCKVMFLDMDAKEQLKEGDGE